MRPGLKPRLSPARSVRRPSGIWLPQALQKRSPTGTSARHDGQLAVSRVPHDPQKRAASAFAEPQLWQTIPLGPDAFLLGVRSSLFVDHLAY